MSGAFVPTKFPSRCLVSLLALASLAPSVGNCQPTRWVRIDDPGRRTAVIANFRGGQSRGALQPMNGRAGADFTRGLSWRACARRPFTSPVFCDEETPQGHGLGVPDAAADAALFGRLRPAYVSVASPRACMGSASAGSRSSSRGDLVATLDIPPELVLQSPISAWDGRRRSIGRRSSSAPVGRRGSTNPLLRR